MKSTPSKGALRARRDAPLRGSGTVLKAQARQSRPRNPTTKPKARGRPSLITRMILWILRLIWKVLWRLGLVGGLCLGVAVGVLMISLPDLGQLLDDRARGSVTLLDRSGSVFARRGDQFGGVVTAASVSPHLRDAIIATEDKRFRYHPGVDPIGIFTAVRINLREGRGPFQGHGGSSITQQTAKLLCLGQSYNPDDWPSEAAYVRDCRSASLLRKLKEAVYALALEAKFTKDEILSIYLNRVYMGGGAYGSEAASQRYFSKSASQLTPAEAAMLAGLLTAPSRLAPTTNLKRSQDRSATVLRLMGEQGYLTAEEVSFYQNTPATLSQQAREDSGGYFADWLMEATPDFLTSTTTEDVIILSTLDRRVQTMAEEALDHIFETKVKPNSKAQAAIVVMSSDGAVRAMVGGRKSVNPGGFNRATHAKRQTGSAFKPFVYGTALELGRSPYDQIEDAPFCMQIAGSGEWCPRNYSKDFAGPVTLTEALSQSLNIPAVKLAEDVGRDKVRMVAEGFGILSELAAGPALALGASEASLLEMTGAYAGILNGGSSVSPYGLVELRLAGEAEPLMTAGTGIGRRVLQREAAGQLVWMLENVVTSGTAMRAGLDGRAAAGKTGTTQAARDAWFIGFTADYVAGVWMGYDDNTPLTGVTGGGLPAEIWHEVMDRIHVGMPVKPLPAIAPAAPLPQDQEISQPSVFQRILQDIFGGGSDGQ